VVLVVRLRVQASTPLVCIDVMKRARNRAVTWMSVTARRGKRFSTARVADRVTALGPVARPTVAGAGAGDAARGSR
jgi:hypothetical protein